MQAITLKKKKSMRKFPLNRRGKALNLIKKNIETKHNNVPVTEITLNFKELLSRGVVFP